ncbi:MAG: ribosome maturation factor RimP [Firmicutes bacterium]|nr:ribosome maturation factor RimP [Bacillota bacterium]
MKKTEFYETIAKLLEPFLTDSALELIDVEYRKEGKNWFLRIFIDKPGGVQLADCENISNFLSSRLDELDLIPHHYILEVSSPGIERPLRKPEDFLRYRGSRISLKTHNRVQGKKNFQGVLVDYLDNQVILQTDEGDFMIPYEAISQAKLKVF